MDDLQHERGRASEHVPAFALAAACGAASAAGALLRLTLRCTLGLLRWAICAALVLGEPVVRAVLVPVAFLGFLVTLIFGFVLGDPRFPRWGMLAFSIGVLMVYWLYLGLMSIAMALPTLRHDR